ncbi:hypothetical protein B0T17DRAFT_654851 [Bombardia bombarda]|uniref:Peptidase A1 domain-containing protein n=1 Tax=Bombardia bombarda TaxID=252184 RepID=A0AA39X0K9_9PEZI|nr:hypothetical protein B0T17DRAFT_654851 [Bombardia bombarda]
MTRQVFLAALSLILHSVSASPRHAHHALAITPSESTSTQDAFPSIRPNGDQSQDKVVRLSMRRRPPVMVSRVVKEDDAVLPPTRVDSVDVVGPPTPSASPSQGPVHANTTAMFKDVAYSIQMWIGTPPQMVMLDFDTGSSETWVDPPCTEMESFPPYEKLCREMGIFVPEQSNTVIDTNGTCPSHWIFYGSGETFIKYYRDKITFKDPLTFFEISSNFQLDKPVQFGVSIWAENMPAGLFGAAYGIGYNQNYSSIIDEMHAQELIQDKDFSVALGSVDEEHGEILFGGIDLGKFSGHLHPIDIASQLSRDIDGYYRYWINVTYIGVTEPGSCVSIPVTNSTFEERFLPDTGTTMTYMPAEALDGILEFFPDAESRLGYGYEVDCAHLDDEGTVDFGFGPDVTIRVPYRDFIYQMLPELDPDSPEGEVTCMLGAIPTEQFFILGDTFLRAVYAVFRQQEHKVYLAQLKECDSNVVSSHGDISQLMGDCISPLEGPPGTQPLELYGLPPPPEPISEPVPCPMISTGTYTPVTSSTATGTAFVSFGDSEPNMFPKPAIQTGNPHDTDFSKHVKFDTTTITSSSIPDSSTFRPRSVLSSRGHQAGEPGPFTNISLTIEGGHSVLPRPPGTNRPILTGSSNVWATGTSTGPRSTSTSSRLYHLTSKSRLSIIKSTSVVNTVTVPPVTLDTTTLSETTMTLVTVMTDKSTPVAESSLTAESESDCSSSSSSSLRYHHHTRSSSTPDYSSSSTSDDGFYSYSEFSFSSTSSDKSETEESTWYPFSDTTTNDKPTIIITFTETITATYTYPGSDTTTEGTFSWSTDTEITDDWPTPTSSDLWPTDSGFWSSDLWSTDTETTDDWPTATSSDLSWVWSSSDTSDTSYISFTGLPFPSSWSEEPSPTTESEAESDTVITIPVETEETVIVEMGSTTYTIVNGKTLDKSFTPSSTSESSFTTPTPTPKLSVSSVTPFLTSSTLKTSRRRSSSSSSFDLSTVPTPSSPSFSFPSPSSPSLSSTDSDTETAFSASSSPSGSFSDFSYTTDADGYITNWAWTTEAAWSTTPALTGLAWFTDFTDEVGDSTTVVVSTVSVWSTVTEGASGSSSSSSEEVSSSTTATDDSGTDVVTATVVTTVEVWSTAADDTATDFVTATVVATVTAGTATTSAAARALHPRHVAGEVPFEVMNRGETKQDSDGMVKRSDDNEGADAGDHQSAKSRATSDATDVFVQNRCRMSPCLFAMQERGNLMRAVAFCTELLLGVSHSSSSGEDRKRAAAAQIEVDAPLQPGGGKWEEDDESVISGSGNDLGRRGAELEIPRYLHAGCGVQAGELAGRGEEHGDGRDGESVSDTVESACKCLVETFDAAREEVEGSRGLSERKLDCNQESCEMN